MLLPRPGGLQTSLSLVLSDACGSLHLQEPGLSSEDVSESPIESASSHEAWPTCGDNAIMGKKLEKEKEGESNCPEQSVIRKVSSLDKMSLRDVASEQVEIISERMHSLTDELLEKLKNELRAILEGTGGSQHREEFLILQKLVKSRADLTATTLITAHRVQLEILVAINTGITAFLHPNISLSQACLIEVFVYKRCRNIACQNQLPAGDCTCELCTNRNGFCNLCMCVICNKFGFEVNTCHWIGCDLCSHWTHTDCAIRNGQIGMGPCVKSGPGPTEMLFRCRACNRTSKLLGWVKDVFQNCVPCWDRDTLISELDFVSRIFHGSEDPRGQKLFWKCEDVIGKMKGGLPESTACKILLLFFQELEVDPTKNPESEEGGQLIAPQEACNRITDVVQEAIRKIEMVTEEKMRMFKKARLSLEACDKELEDKAKEVEELKLERQRKKQHIDELDSVARLKQAEAEMFQLKACEARREVKRLQRIVFAKSEKAEEYASRYLKLRLNDAEAEKQYLFEKIKLQESSWTSQSSGRGSDSSQMLMLCKIQDLLKNVYNVPPKAETQPNDHHSLGSVP
ncbi:PREDICTED: OBERON-like protein [Nelumbo nucifera]|uniref:OBERON-like protein n=1 Tax=Nelumbo nucifera TaxID=4432 RepID=A0A1U7ZW41_NELNU|nr:PREDICTED: OBERON-like protein [Nelumbo nucifera]XP_010252716.1 PREDICTED: OBERON-like protein [Nelumbo nucifera]